MLRKVLDAIYSMVRDAHGKPGENITQTQCSECPGFRMVYSEKYGIFERHDCKCIARIEDPVQRDEARYRKTSNRLHCRWTGD